MAKAVKLSDIAREVGVSTVAVSKALSDQKGVSDELRAVIKNKAEEMGYIKSFELRKPVENKSYNIGVLIPEQHLDKYDSFYMHLYKQLTAKAVSKDSFTMMEPLTSEMLSENKMPKLLEDGKVDGAILLGLVDMSYRKFLAANAQVPILFMDFSDEYSDVDSVMSDSFYGAYYLTNYLFKNGHEKIAYVGTLLSTSSITDRYLGYLKAMMEHGIEVKKEWIIKDRDIHTSKIDPDLMIFPEDMPTAFVCNCDLTASALIKKLQDNGYKVPDDISVVGYDNFLFPGLCNIPITTYEVDAKEMARAAINKIIRNIKGEKYHKGGTIIEGHLVEKSSVKKLN